MHRVKSARIWSFSGLNVGKDGLEKLRIFSRCDGLNQHETNCGTNIFWYIKPEKAST